MKSLVLLLIMTAVGTAQSLDLKSLDSLNAKATDSVDIKLDGSLLKMAATLLSSSDADESRIKKLVSGLTGVYVKTFEFASAGQYSESSVESIRAQLGPPNWTRVMAVKSNKDGENTEIFMRGVKDGQVGELVIISAEPRELSVVQIVGVIKPADLRDLAGNFGIPEKLKKETK
jgi:hypothetical protein